MIEIKVVSGKQEKWMRFKGEEDFQAWFLRSPVVRVENNVVYLGASSLQQNDKIMVLRKLLGYDPTPAGGCCGQ